MFFANDLISSKHNFLCVHQKLGRVFLLAITDMIKYGVSGDQMNARSKTILKTRDFVNYASVHCHATSLKHVPIILVLQSRGSTSIFECSVNSIWEPLHTFEFCTLHTVAIYIFSNNIHLKYIFNVTYLSDILKSSTLFQYIGSFSVDVDVLSRRSEAVRNHLNLLRVSLSFWWKEIKLKSRWKRNEDFSNSETTLL